MDFPTERQTLSDVIPVPADESTARTNPPGFAWLPMDTAQQYRIRIHACENDAAVLDATTSDNLFVPSAGFAPGEYRWTVEALAADGSVLATRAPYHLTIPPEVLQQPYPDMDALLDSLPARRPRIIFTEKRLAALRERIRGPWQAEWNRLQRAAEDAIDMGLPEPPGYADIRDRVILKNESVNYARYCRPYIIYAQHALALAYLISGDPRYAAEGRKRFFSIGEWAAKGPASLISGHQDAPGMALCYSMHHIYDWLVETMSNEEKQRGAEICVAIARDNWQRVGVKSNYHRQPGSSHPGRLIAYIGEQALALHDVAPRHEVRTWLDFSLKAFMTIFPHWGGPDGGWNEGIAYGTGYNLIYLPWIESLRTLTDIDLWTRPFFGQVRNFFMRCCTPNDEMRPFGDGAGPRTGDSLQDANLYALIQHHARRFQDPAAAWWTQHMSPTYHRPEHGLLPRWISPRQVDPSPPADGRIASAFNGIGWCAMHSDLADLKHNVFVLFKSSPYGSVSHQHADQNSFYLSAGGHALAIPSGYYGPFYGAPHHAEWTRQTKAQNAILVDGEGQTDRDHRATGRLLNMAHSGQLTYVCGDASPAYDGRLRQWRRHLFFLRPGLLAVVDDINAPQAARLQWLLHTLETMDIDEEHQALQVRRREAAMTAQLFSDLAAPLRFSLSDRFDPPYATGQPDDYVQTRPNQWHVTAETPKATPRVRIVAILTAGPAARMPDVRTVQTAGTVTATIQTASGTGSVELPLDPEHGIGRAHWQGDHEESIAR